MRDTHSLDNVHRQYFHTKIGHRRSSACQGHVISGRPRLDGLAKSLPKTSQDFQDFPRPPKLSRHQSRVPHVQMLRISHLLHQISSYNRFDRRQDYAQHGDTSGSRLVLARCSLESLERPSDRNTPDICSFALWKLAWHEIWQEILSQEPASWTSGLADLKRHLSPAFFYSFLLPSPTSRHFSLSNPLRSDQQSRCRLCHSSLRSQLGSHSQLLRLINVWVAALTWAASSLRTSMYPVSPRRYQLRWIVKLTRLLVPPP